MQSVAGTAKRNAQALLASLVALSTTLSAMPAYSAIIITTPPAQPKPQQPVFIPPPMPQAPPPPPSAPVVTTTTTLVAPPKLDIPVGINLPWIPPKIDITHRRPKKDKPVEKTPEKKKEKEQAKVAETKPEPKKAEPVRMQPLPGVYVFSMNCGGGLCNTDNKFEFVPSRGALYSLESEDHVNLARGHMLIIAGDINVNLTAGKMHVQILPGSSMVAEVDPDGSARLYSLPTFERTHPAALIGPQPELGLANAATLHAGEAAVIAHIGLEAEELIAADGLELAPVEGTLKLVEQTNGRMHLVNYSVKRMLDDEYLIGCRRVTVPPTERMSQLRSTLQTAAVGERVNHNKPVSFIERVDEQRLNAKASVNASPIINSNGITAVADDDSIYNLNDDGSINLLTGSFLIRAEKNTVVNTGAQQVRINKGAIAIVKAKSGITKVINLSDLANQSVQVITHVGIDSRAVDIAPAQELIFSAKAPNLGHIFDVHQVGHHSIVSQQIGETWVTTSEVALTDELMYQPLLLTIRTNSNYKSVKNIFVNQIVKTAAIFQMLHVQTNYVRGEVEDETTAFTMIADKGCASCTK